MWRRRESWEGVNGGTNLPNKKGRWMWRRRESWEGGDGEDGGLTFAMEKVDVDEERRYKIDG